MVAKLGVNEILIECRFAARFLFIFCICSITNTPPQDGEYADLGLKKLKPLFGYQFSQCIRQLVFRGYMGNT